MNFDTTSLGNCTRRISLWAIFFELRNMWRLWAQKLTSKRPLGQMAHGFELIAAMRSWLSDAEGTESQQHKSFIVILFCSHRLLAVFGGKISLMFGLSNWIKPPLENKTRSKLRWILWGYTLWLLTYPYMIYSTNGNQVVFKPLYMKRH